MREAPSGAWYVFIGFFVNDWFCVAKCVASDEAERIAVHVRSRIKREYGWSCLASAEQVTDEESSHRLLDDEIALYLDHHRKGIHTLEAEAAGWAIDPTGLEKSTEASETSTPEPKPSLRSDELIRSDLVQLSVSLAVHSRLLEHHEKVEHRKILIGQKLHSERGATAAFANVTAFLRGLESARVKSSAEALGEVGREVTGLMTLMINVIGPIEDEIESAYLSGSNKKVVTIARNALRSGWERFGADMQRLAARVEVMAHDVRPSPVERPQTTSAVKQTKSPQRRKTTYCVMIPEISRPLRTPTTTLMSSLQMVLANLINALYDPDPILIENDLIEDEEEAETTLESDPKSVAQWALHGLGVVSMFAEVALDFIDKIKTENANAQAVDLVREISGDLLLVAAEVAVSYDDEKKCYHESSGSEALDDARNRLENLREMLGIKLKAYCAKLAVTSYEISGQSSASVAPLRASVEDQGKRASLTSPSHSDDFTSLNWFGHHYIFSKGQQAEAIKLLYQAWKMGGHGLSQETIKERVGSGATRSDLSKVFRKKRAEGKGYEPHPAWGTLIQSVSRGVYRLVEPESAKNPQ